MRRARTILLLFLALLIATQEADAYRKKPSKRKRPKRPKAAQTELDPIRAVKIFTDPSTRIGPNVVIAIDVSPRMQQDFENTYYDLRLYDKDKDATSRAVAATLGVSAGARWYRRRFTNFERLQPGSTSQYSAATIQVMDELHPDYLSFFEPSRLGMARDGLAQAVSENMWLTRVGLLRSRRGDGFKVPDPGNQSPVLLTDPAQNTLAGDLGVNRWKVSYAVTSTSNLSAKAEGNDLVVKAEDSDSSAKTLQQLELNPDESDKLTPAGQDATTIGLWDSPITNLLVDARTEVVRVMSSDDDKFRPCRNTAVVLVVGGTDGGGAIGQKTDPAAIAGTFQQVTAKGVTRRVPVHVVAIGPPEQDIPELERIATNSGGRFFLALDANEVAQAMTHAIQDVHREPVDFDANQPSLFQTVPPVVGTVDLTGASDLSGRPLPNTGLRSGSTPIRETNNVILTAGFTLPGFGGSLRAYRTYAGVADSSRPTGYKFSRDGTALWVAHAPGESRAGWTDPQNGAIDPGARNIYTYLPGTGIVEFTAAQAGLLRSSLGADTDEEAAELVEFVRAQPLGAFISSTPAVLSPPVAGAAADNEYRTFATERASRRAVVFVGGNDGMLHAIDGRLGVEAWAFVPYNLLPKLRALVDGQPMGAYDYFVDASPKIADVKVAGRWRTYLMIGQGAGGTFYQTFDVSDAGLGVNPRSDSESAVLGAFSNPMVIPLAWSFPSYASFDPAFSSADMPYGDLKAGATALERTVGETWSTPAIVQVRDVTGPFVAFVGSGYLASTTQAQSNRGGTAGGARLYALDIATGAVLSSHDVGDDANRDHMKNALQADPVPAGSGGSRFADRVYAGDTEGNLWRFRLAAIGSSVTLLPPVKIYDVNAAHPIYGGLAVVNAGGDQHYVFFATGIDTLPFTKKIEKFRLIGLYDTGGTMTCTRGDKKCQTFEVTLLKADSEKGDERPTSQPAIAGDVVYFTTVTEFPDKPCRAPETSLYAMTFSGGAAFDTNGDGKRDASDNAVLRAPLGRSTGVFAADGHLYFGLDDDVSILGDPDGFNAGTARFTGRLTSWREVR